jgi:hypothetical protein
LAEPHHGEERLSPRVITSGIVLKDAFRAATAWLEAHSEEINALNVFPVPDGDTGTNMLLTCQAARDEMTHSGNSIAEVMRAISHGSLMGARGNSGVILSQILRGMARSIDNKPSITAHDAASALQEGSITAYKGVIKPVEGTILTVIREMAEGATVAADHSDDLRVVLDAIVDAARSSVERTPSLLPALRLAGVVDAGGYGLLTIFEGIQRYVRGETTAPTVTRRAALERTEEPEEGFGYDVQFIVHGETLNVEAMRQHIAGMGESTLVVGDEHTVKVHTHAPNPGPVLEYGATLGPLSHIIVENMEQQFHEFRDAARSTSPAHSLARPVQELVAAQSSTAAQLTGISTVVVAAGQGFEKLLKSLDCGAIVPGGQTMNPSIQQILAAIEAVPTDKVVVLPNNKNIIMTANEARHLTSKSVVVIPTTTIPQGIAALLALNYDADLDANKQAMEQAAARVRTGEITTAVRTSHINGIDVKKGQIIGLVDDRLVATGADVPTVVMSILGMMCSDDIELLTFYYGNGTGADEAHALVEHVRQVYPGLETETVEGGQPHYMYVISAE